MVGANDSKREWLENVTALKKKKEQELKDVEDRKKKELDELEDKKKKELKEADEILKAGIEGISIEKEEIHEQLKKEKHVSEEPEQSLEETIAQENITEEAKPTGPAYEIPIEQTVNQIYQNTNYNVYNELAATLEKVNRGDYLTQKERQSFYQRQEEIERVSSNKELIDEKDGFGYIDRSKQVIDSINKTLHSSTYKTGDHI